MLIGRSRSVPLPGKVVDVGTLFATNFVLTFQQCRGLA